MTTARNREARLYTPLGEDELLLRRLRGTEALSRPYEYRLECLSESPSIDLDALLGAGAGVEMETESGDVRHIDGIVSNVAHTSRHGKFAAYALTLRPWLWLLSRTSDDRIFTDLSTPDILARVFDEAGFTDYDLRLSGDYPPWHHRVQYRESTLDFVSRLMEHEGIYYHFLHERGRNTLVLCDDPGAHESVPGHAEVPHFPGEIDERREVEHLVDWHVERRVTSARYAMRDFGFGDPRRDLLVDASESVAGQHPALELYEYPAALPTRESGELERADGTALVRRRLESEHVGGERSRGRGNVRALACGRRFTLTGGEREDQNREHLIVATDFEIDLGAHFGGEEAGGAQFRVALECIDARVPFRPPRTTPKPLIRGPQTAIVTGPAGEELWTDRHGRVKLQFHWDRHGKSDENSSCWVRVSQSWAGDRWGGIHVPRIGQEVIVEYVDGDPDRPIVTGRVYNGDRPVPYELPANATRSGLKSRSSKGGSADTFNEISMEDKKGEEELYFHAEKDQITVVENDRSELVGRDHSVEIGRDCSEKIGNNRLIDVAVNHTETIGAAMSLTVGASLTESIGANASETVGIAKTTNVAAAYLINAGAALSLTAGGALTQTVGGAFALTVGGGAGTNVGGDGSTNIGGNMSLDVGKDSKIDVGGEAVTKVKDGCSLNAGKVQIVAKDEISLKAGSAEIVLKKNGDISIKGKKINIKGSGDVVVKGSKIKEN